jgi:Fe-S-cluster containining protein
MGAAPTVPPLDLEPLRGFRYACRPGCGLCCYAEPRVLAHERARLLQIQPEAEFARRGPFEFLAAHPDGGACRLLGANRCRAHAARPQPCREFPVMVHVGSRLQATIVLSCPGVELDSLGSTGASPPLAPDAFETELAAVRGRLDSSVARRLEAAGRRRRRLAGILERQGRWEEETDVRERLGSLIPRPSDADFPAEDPPRTDDGIENLPLFYDGRAAPVAISSGLGGWELHELSPSGGFARSLGVIPPPDRAPPVSSEGTKLLEGYLRYWLARDAFFGSLHLEMMDAIDGTVDEWALRELRAIGALTVARAAVRAKAGRGDAGPLSEADIASGIRATDQDLLDRASWGERL